MNKHGGYRPGAGRKIGSKNKRPAMVEEAHDILVQKVLDYWHPLLETKLNLALGDFYIEKEVVKGKSITKVIYTAAPDSSAINDLLYFVLGRPATVVMSPPPGNGGNVDGINQLADGIRSILTGRMMKDIETVDVIEPKVVKPVVKAIVKQKPAPVTVPEKKTIELNYTPLPAHMLIANDTKRQEALAIDPLSILSQ